MQTCSHSPWKLRMGLYFGQVLVPGRKAEVNSVWILNFQSPYLGSVSLTRVSTSSIILLRIVESAGSWPRREVPRSNFPDRELENPSCSLWEAVLLHPNGFWKAVNPKNRDSLASLSLPPPQPFSPLALSLQDF